MRDKSEGQELPVPRIERLMREVASPPDRRWLDASAEEFRRDPARVMRRAEAEGYAGWRVLGEDGTARMVCALYQNATQDDVDAAAAEALPELLEAVRAAAAYVRAQQECGVERPVETIAEMDAWWRLAASLSLLGLYGDELTRETMRAWRERRGGP